MKDISEKRLSDYMAEQIADEILSGRIPGGSQLKQEELAEAFEASRIPIREAFQILENQGLIIGLKRLLKFLMTYSIKHIIKFYNKIGEKMELGVYVHIPFCVKKCYYCDFVSYPNKFEMQEDYVRKLIEEIEDNKDLLKNNEITTIYIGGGTPSSIKPELIKNVLNKICEFSNIKNKEKIEITIEVNPGTVTKNNLQMYRNCGINRLSIGLQSTNDKLLNEIGRIHNYEQFLHTYNWAVEAGFSNINVDLMLGLPNQSISDLKESLEKIVSLCTL